MGAIVMGAIQNVGYLYVLASDRRSGTGHDTGLICVLKKRDPI